LGSVSLFDGWPFGPVVAFGAVAGEPLGLPRSGPLPAFMPVVLSRIPELVIPPLLMVALLPLTPGVALHHYRATLSMKAERITSRTGDETLRQSQEKISQKIPTHTFGRGLSWTIATRSAFWFSWPCSQLLSSPARPQTAGNACRGASRKASLGAGTIR
jgi:hypothetical protein